MTLYALRYGIDHDVVTGASRFRTGELSGIRGASRHGKVIQNVLAASKLAFKIDFAAKQLGQFFDNRKPQTRAGVLARQTIALKNLSRFA